MSELKEKVIRMSQERDEFVLDVDGFYYYWPQPERGGHYSAQILRILADELDRRNKDWEDHLSKALSEVPKDEPKS